MCNDRRQLCFRWFCKICYIGFKTRLPIEVVLFKRADSETEKAAMVSFNGVVYPPLSASLVAVFIPKYHFLFTVIFFVFHSNYILLRILYLKCQNNLEV